MGGTRARREEIAPAGALRSSKGRSTSGGARAEPRWARSPPPRSPERLAKQSSMKAPTGRFHRLEGTGRRPGSFLGFKLSCLAISSWRGERRQVFLA